MIHGKPYLRNKFLKKRGSKFLLKKKFNFNLIFKLVRKYFKKNKITIAGYYPTNHEVDILNFLKKAEKKKYKLTLPVIRDNGKMNFRSWRFLEPLYVSKFGTLEPNDSGKDILPDLILVPLVAFDKQLNRIGYGKGFYDRFLSKVKKVKKKSISLGIAYSFQEYSKIPADKHDFKLDYIFTESGIIKSN